MKDENKKEKVPIWEKFNLSILEAAQYFNIGEKKLRQLVNSNPEANYILWIGSKALIKRTAFEKVLLSENCI